jgi:SAM-dependent methyltransferase
LKRIRNIIKYGLGSEAKQRKQADKRTAREDRFETDLWQRDASELAQRQYRSYDEYISHQRAKLDKISDRLHETEQEDFLDFKQRFSDCQALKPGATVLCLGARLGTEVKALHTLGYFAVGIDLNPGPDNPFVLPGDFHHIVFPDDSVDVVYTNALDHVFDLQKIVAEIQRLLRPGGIFIADIIEGYEEGFVPGAYEAIHWPTVEKFVGKLSELGDLQLESLRDLGRNRRDSWKQAVFRKPVP